MPHNHAVTARRELQRLISSQHFARLRICKSEVVAFVSLFGLHYILANFLLVPADGNKLQRKDSRNISSTCETCISHDTAAVTNCG
jgi:hypothetical protein